MFLPKHVSKEETYHFIQEWKKCQIEQSVSKRAIRVPDSLVSNREWVRFPLHLVKKGGKGDR